MRIAEVANLIHEAGGHGLETRKVCVAAVGWMWMARGWTGLEVEISP